MTTLRTPLIVVVFIVLIGGGVATIYWPGLHGSFFFDDAPSILLPEGVRLESLTLESIRQVFSSGDSGPSGRPVAQLSFALNYFANGFDPFYFKASNLAIHMACGILIFCLAFRLLDARESGVKDANTLAVAGVLATAWLLHPLQLTPVLHVVQRMTSLSALFLLAATLMYLSARKENGFPSVAKLCLAWGVLWPLSFLSKESGALFPFLILAWELIIRRSRTGNLDRFARIFAATAGLVLLASAAYLFSARGQWIWAGYNLRAFTLFERLLTEGRVLCFYLALIFFPRLEALGLYHDDIELSTGLLTPWTTLPAIAGLLGLIYLVWWARKRAPLVSFGIAWFFIGHALESTVLPLEIAHEHRNYLPLFGILLTCCWALIRALQQSGVMKTIGIVLASAMLANFTFVTALRAHQFGDEGRRTQIEAQHHRTSARAQYDAGQIMAQQADAVFPDSPIHSFAGTHYRLACELDPNSKMCWLGLIELECKAGKFAEPLWITELGRRLRETPFAPGDRNVLYSLKEMAIVGRICLDRQQVDGLFFAAIGNPTTSLGVQSMLHSWHADYLWLREHDLVAARRSLSQSLKLNSTNLSNRLKWAQLILLSGELEQARQLLIELRGTSLSIEERKTLNELLAAYNMAEH